MERTTILLVILCIILSILFITFLVLYVRKSGNSVSKGNVPKVLSSYATIPNVDSTSIKSQYTCSGTGTADGQIGTKLCTFNGISSLYQAIDTCNTYTFSGDNSYANCNGFYYNSTNGTVQFINTQYSITGATNDSPTNGDVYLRQFNF
jgi:hypothetical protein